MINPSYPERAQKDESSGDLSGDSLPNETANERGNCSNDRGHDGRGDWSHMWERNLLDSIGEHGEHGGMGRTMATRALALD